VHLQLSADKAVILGMNVVKMGIKLSLEVCLPLTILALEGCPRPGIVSDCLLIDLPPDHWKGLLPDAVWL
jgi:hypothetical protein